MTTKVIVFGVGGNCIDILDTLLTINETMGRPFYECVGFLDDSASKWGQSYQGVPVIGPIRLAETYTDCFFVNGIGSPTNFWLKPEIIARSNLPIDRFVTVVHPTASVSRMSKIGKGVVILQNVTLASNVTVGDHVIVLPNSILSHDSAIGDYTCVAGGVCVSGGVHVGQSCYLGSNSSIKGNIELGDRCLVGMGSVVLQSVPENTVVVGNPAKFLRTTTN